MLQSWRKCLHRNCCNHGANVSTVVVVLSQIFGFSLISPLVYLGGAISSVTFNYILLWFSNRLPIFFGLKINIFGSSLVCVEINILYLIWSLKLELCLLFDVGPGSRWSSLRNWNHQQRRLIHWCQLEINMLTEGFCFLMFSFSNGVKVFFLDGILLKLNSNQVYSKADFPFYNFT